MKSLRPSGYSLIELLVVVAISSIVALGGAALIQRTMTATSTQQLHTNAADFKEELRAMLSRPDACFNSFGGIVLNGATDQLYAALNDVDGLHPLQKSYISNAGGAVSTANPIENTLNTQVTQFRLLNYQDLPNVPSYGIATLRMLVNTQAQVDGSQTLTRDIVIRTKKDAANALVYCVAQSKTLGTIWQQAPAPNNTDLIFNGGGVGVGAPVPGGIPLNVSARTAGSWTLGWGAVGGATQSAFINDQGGSIELGAPATPLTPAQNTVANGAPYVDFHTPSAPAVDFNMRIQNKADQVFTVDFPSGGAPQEIARFQGNLGFSQLGVGLTPSAAYTVDVAPHMNLETGLFINNVQVLGSTGPWPPISDARLKEKVKPLVDPLGHLLKIQGYSFEFKDKVRFTKDPQIGLMAQEVEKVYPEIVINDNSSGFKSMTYDRLLSPLVESVKSIYTSLTDLEGQVTELVEKHRKLKEDNFAFKKRLTALEQQLAQPE